MTVKRLPAELTDRIIDHLHSDKRALAMCSLVCKTWLPASRYHSHTEICLTVHNIQSFTELLNSPACTFFGHAVDVDISVYDDPDDGPGILSTISYRLFRLNIKSLRLNGVNWDIRDEELEEVLRCLAAISALEMWEVTFSDPNQFVKFATSFVSLERLSLPGLSFQTDDAAHIPSFTLSPLLRFVDLNLSPDLLWFLLAAQFPPLNHIKLSWITSDDLDAVQALLQFSGPSLHNLFLHFDFDESDIGGRVSLKQNTRLRYLDVSGICGANLLDILSQITSFDLETIHFGLFGCETANVEMVEWNQVAQVLTQPRFAKLQKVTLSLESHTGGLDSCAGWVDYIRTRMSILSNILHVSGIHLPSLLFF